MGMQCGNFRLELLPLFFSSILFGHLRLFLLVGWNLAMLRSNQLVSRSNTTLEGMSLVVRYKIISLTILPILFVLFDELVEIVEKFDEEYLILQNLYAIPLIDIETKLEQSI